MVCGAQYWLFIQKQCKAELQHQPLPCTWQNSLGGNDRIVKGALLDLPCVVDPKTGLAPVHPNVVVEVPAHCVNGIVVEYLLTLVAIVRRNEDRSLPVSYLRLAVKVEQVA